MERCSKIEKMINNGELETDLVTELPSELQNHINECAECSELVSDLKKVSDIINSTERLTVSVSFDEKLKAGIKAATDGNNVRIPFFRKAFYYAAGIAAVVIGSFYISTAVISENSEQGPAFLQNGIQVASAEESKEPGELKDSLIEMRKVVIDDEELRMRVAAE